MKIPTFNYNVTEKKRGFDNENIFRSYLRSLKGGKYYISVKKYRQKRSNEQNRYYWGVIIKMICQEVGYEHWESKIVHAELGQLFYLEEGKLGKYVRSTTSYNAAEFEIKMELIRRWALDVHNLPIPLPNEVPAEQLKDWYQWAA